MGERKKLDYDAFLARGAYDSFDIQYCLDRLMEADRAFQEADALLQATEDITGIDYASQSDRFYRILDAYGKLRRFMNRYVEEVWDVDKEFYSAIANGPAEALSHVRLEDIKIPNTLGLSNHDARAGTDIPLSHLSIKNFIREPEALNNNYVRGFAELFQEDVEMAGETMTLKEFLEELENAAAYSNDIHKPWLEALSVLLNMASFGVKPLYECICGYDIITGEQLSTGERVWTGVEAVLDFLPVFGVAKAAEQGLVKALGAETVNGIEAQLRGGVLGNEIRDISVLKDIPGRVQSRINVANGQTRFTPLRASGEPVSAGFNHVLNQHFNRPLANSRSVFSITPDELKIILQSDVVVNSPVEAISNGQYIRIVNTRQIIGNTALKYGGGETTWIKVFTDEAGNLITAFPVPAPN